MFTNPISTVIISVIRIRYLKLFEDFPWENAAASMWSIAELTTAIICCCLPTLRPLVGRYFPNVLGSVSGRTTGGAPYAAYGKSSNGGKSTARSRTDAEMGSKRGGVTLSGNDSSEVELASARSHKGKGSKHDLDLNRDEGLSPFRNPTNDDDARSVASEASELALRPKRHGVGVRTSIGPARPEGAVLGRMRSFSGGGVQVQREVYQTTSVVGCEVGK